MAKVPESAPATVLPLALRRYVYFTASVTGAAIMIVEILGARMLSPYIGTSHFVWTAQIAVTLVALACGYYAGGRLADRSPRLSYLYWGIFIAAAYLALTILVSERVAYWCLELKLALGSLLASAILFFVPLGLLAMTGPFLVRIITSNLAGVGGNVGRLTSIGTLGSFVGTLLIGYVLIPFLPNSWTMYLTSLALMLISAGYFAFFRRNAGPASAITVSALLLVLAPATERHAPYRVVVERFRGDSHFGEIQVLDRKDSPVRYLLNDNLIQNAYDTAARQSTLSFSYLLAELPRAYRTNISEVLVIGMGVGIVPMDFARTGARVDTVEINPMIVDAAVRYFDFDPRRVSVVLGDGRYFLNETRRSYDLVILDAFVGDSFPSHLMTRETFATARKLLRPGGILVVHSFGDLEDEKAFLLGSLKKTLGTVFDHQRVHTSGEGAFFFLASDASISTPHRVPRFDLVHPKARKEVELAFLGDSPAIPNVGLVLTDDYNPADFFDAHNREDLRRTLARSARTM